MLLFCFVLNASGEITTLRKDALELEKSSSLNTVELVLQCVCSISAAAPRTTTSTYHGCRSAGGWRVQELLTSYLFCPLTPSLPVNHTQLVISWEAWVMMMKVFFTQSPVCTVLVNLQKKNPTHFTREHVSLLIDSVSAGVHEDALQTSDSVMRFCKS